MVYTLRSLRFRTTQHTLQSSVFTQKSHVILPMELRLSKLEWKDAGKLSLRRFRLACEGTWSEVPATLSAPATPDPEDCMTRDPSELRRGLDTLLTAR